jgi:predicted DNA-binding transcriptional regulator AlpA
VVLRPDLDSLPADSLVDTATMALLLSCCPRHVHRMAAAGQLPRPIRLGQLCRWRVGTLRDWLRQEAGNAHAR